MDHNYYVYMTVNWNNKVIYIGMTNDLVRRMYEHQHHMFDGFTKKYNVTKLVYYEHTNSVDAAIAREKQLKRWRRAKKDAPVATMNPQWQDLSPAILTPQPS